MDSKTENNIQEDDIGDDEEDMLIYIEFGGMLDENLLKNPNTFCKLIGVDTDTPIMQIGNQFYQGKYEQTLGTQVFFEKDNDPKKDFPPLLRKQPSQYLKYTAKTEKMLQMQRIFIQKKNTSNAAGDAETSELVLPESYEKALDKLNELASPSECDCSTKDSTSMNN